MSTVSIPRIDPDLAVGMSAEQRSAAERLCQARTVEISEKHWSGRVEGLDRDGLGLLIVSGVLCRRVGQGQSYGAELVGVGDILRPWEAVGGWTSIPTDAQWTVIAKARVAVLDAEFARRASRFPELGSQLLGRALLRSRYLSILLAIVSQRRVETRLTMLFWHLADRFGQMRGEWVEIPIPLTHSVLSELVGARRPSVTTALSRLHEQEIVMRNGSGWRLRGTVPPELLRLQTAPEPSS